MSKLATQLNLYDNNGYTGFGQLGLENKTASDAPILFSTFISSTIGTISIVGVIWFIFNFISGTIGIITAGSDKNALEGAKKKITNGFIGLALTFFALLIINLFAYIAGIGDILDSQTLFGKLIIQ